MLTAQLLGALASIPQPTPVELLAAPHHARYLSQIAAADIAPGHRSIAVLTYRRVYLYCRRSDGDWA